MRVVDFYPHDIRDFAHSLGNASYNDFTEDRDEDDSFLDEYSQPASQWEWGFYLLVEDASLVKGSGSPARMKLLVRHEEAEFLLNMDAVE